MARQQLFSAFVCWYRFENCENMQTFGALDTFVRADLLSRSVLFPKSPTVCQLAQLPLWISRCLSICVCSLMSVYAWHAGRNVFKSIYRSILSDLMVKHAKKNTMSNLYDNYFNVTL